MTTAIPAPRNRLRELVMAALAPLACAAVLTALLTSYVIGGGGTITRALIKVTLAAVPLPASAGRAATAATYITILNLSSSPDELTSVSSAAAARVALTRRAGFPIPAHRSITLSPSGPDIVLISPARLQAGQIVPLTLTFRQAGKITVNATVTPPGTP